MAPLVKRNRSLIAVSGIQMLNVLISEKAPYVVTLFAAALSWLTIRTSDHLATVPFVEYRVASEPKTKPPGFDLRLRNITAGSTFDCFQLMLIVRRGDSLTFGEAKDQQIELRGTVFSSLTVTRVAEREWDIKAEDVAPSADITLFVPSTGQGSPAVLVESCPAQDPSTKNASSDGTSGSPRGLAPVLVEASWATWMLDHEMLILWVALAVWFVVMILLVSCASKKGSPSP